MQPYLIPACFIVALAVAIVRPVVNNVHGGVAEVIFWMTLMIAIAFGSVWGIAEVLAELDR